jgi:nucleoside-diphosphate-sugar epimerase
MGFWKNRRVLVTGGAGFIGSHLVELLVQDRAKVRVADNFERGKKENLAEVIKDIELMKKDLRNLENCRKACHGMEMVFNLAAKVTGIEYNRSHQADMFENNMLLQMFPLKAAALEGVPRFLQLSTACIYPHDAQVPTPESEGTRGEPEPTNAGYGWAKRMGERLAEYYARETSMQIGIVRPFNAYGPRDYYDTATSHVIPALIKKVMDGMNPVEVWGSGNQRRVFVHAKDFAAGLLLLGEKYAVPDPVNLGHDEEVSMKQLLEKIQELTGIKNPPFFNTQMPEGYPKRAADTTKLKKVTGGFVPKISLDEGLQEMIEWYRTVGSKLPL